MKIFDSEKNIWLVIWDCVKYIVAALIGYFIG